MIVIVGLSVGFDDLSIVNAMRLQRGFLKCKDISRKTNTELGHYPGSSPLDYAPIGVYSAINDCPRTSRAGPLEGRRDAHPCFPNRD